MKKIVSTLLASLLAFVTISAMAQFGGLGGLLGGAAKGGADSGGDIDSQVRGFVQQSNDINGLLYVSLKTITAAYESDEEAAKIAAEVKAFNASTDPKERAAKVAEAQKTDGAKLAELAKSADAQEKTKSLTKEKQQRIVISVSNFLVAGLKAMTLAKSGQSLVQSVAANPMSIGKVLPVKDALRILASAASTSVDVIPGFIKVLQGANLTVSKVDANTKTQEVDDWGK